MNRIASFAAAAMMAAGPRIAFAADDAAGAAAPATLPPGHTEFEFPNLEGKRTFDVALIPSDVRMDFLKGAVRQYIQNRLNGLHSRYEKDPVVAAWAAYDAATKADALQTAVPKPEGNPPAPADYEDAYTRAIADLTSGNVRRLSAEPKARKVADPLVSTVTSVVARDVFNSRKAADPKYTYIMAKAEVGPDGIAYLNKMIDAKVAAGADRAQLEAMRDTRYIGPAKAMLGITTDKKVAALPSIL